MTFLERYIDGQTKQVYEDIDALGTAAFLPENFPEIERVLTETFRRVAGNLAVIYSELKQTGYLFKTDPVYNFEKPLHHPLPDTGILLDKLDLAVAPFGFVPLSLKYFYRIVGGVNFAWDYETNENIPWERADPVQVASLDTVVSEVTGTWWRKEMQQYVDDKNSGTAFLELSADELHKDNISGGPAYALQITKQLSVDSLFMNEPNDTSFINYLRICFAYGGFPGMAGRPVNESFQAFLEKIEPRLQMI